MTILTIDVLKKIIENVPEEFTVEHNNKSTIVPIDNRIEIDVSGKRLILK